LVQVLGVDMWAGSVSELNTFRLLTGTTYPLLWAGQEPAGGDLDILYGPYDNPIVIDMRDTTVVYHAALTWPHGNRYHLDEIRAAVDGVLATVDAGPPASGRNFLRVAPNPVQDRLLSPPGARPKRACRCTTLPAGSAAASAPPSARRVAAAGRGPSEVCSVTRRAPASIICVCKPPRNRSFAASWSCHSEEIRRHAASAVRP
jgi:hypothetical protein